jgi:hypothetical protein
MMASSGCFFAHLSYSLTIASLAFSFFMLAMRTPSGKNICLERRFYEAKMALWGTGLLSYRQWCRQRAFWRVQITWANGSKHRIGKFGTKEEAEDEHRE